MADIHDTINDLQLRLRDLEALPVVVADRAKVAKAKADAEAKAAEDAEAKAKADAKAEAKAEAVERRAR